MNTFLMNDSAQLLGLFLLVVLVLSFFFDLKTRVRKITPQKRSAPRPLEGLRIDSPVEPESPVTAAIEPKPFGLTEPEPEPVAAVAAEQPSGESVFAKIKQGLGRTHNNLVEGLAGLILGQKTIDEDVLEEIETQLLTADVGVEATQHVITMLTEALKREDLSDADTLYETLKNILRDILEPCSIPLQAKEQGKPFVVLMVGVNGAGKTTTIGKLAKRFQNEGLTVMLAAGDTFRAAAVEQLEEWGRRNEVSVVAQHTGADSASVIYDALESARARGVDVLIADTAGRLQNKDNLMAELVKVKRVMAKLDPSAPHEVMLVLDAGTGQNALSQARLFNEAVGITGITITKLDGTAKGGVIFAVAKQLGIPIRFIGVGETVDDLRTFDADQFVTALFD